MPSSNPVYQPTTTTVTYERHKEWSGSYLTETVTANCNQKPYLQRLLLVGSILLIIVGLLMSIYALVAETNANKEDAALDAADVDLSLDDSDEENSESEMDGSTNEDHNENPDHGVNMVLGSLGISLIILGLGMYFCFLKIRGMWKGLHMLPNSSAGAQCLEEPDRDEESGHAEAISYKGVQEANSLNLEPAAPAEEERHSLMDSKYPSDDTERMMDDDPRIVLKPLRTAEDA